MSDAKRGDFVQVLTVVLQPSDRAGNLPSSTKSVPYECWIKGFLVDEAAMKGDQVTIETFIGRNLKGILYEINPKYMHDFGEPQGEILSIGNEARKLIGQKGRIGRG
jgi:hypothetical protein